MKKILYSIFASLLLCLSTVASAQRFRVGSLDYEVLSQTERTVEVTQGDCITYGGSIAIPPTVTYDGTTYDVVALGELAFERTNITSITIPSSIKTIKKNCFYNANCPTTIDIPASVTKIEGAAFAAKGLKNINVDENNPNYRTIDGMLFTKDSTTIVTCPIGKNEPINLPQNIKHIFQYAFSNCKITSITLPEGLISIGHWAFSGNTQLKRIVIPSTVTLIESGPFTSCTSLSNLTIAEGNNHYYMDGFAIYSIGGDTLVSCHKSADSINLPNTLRVVDGLAYNKDLKYIHFPEGVKKICAGAFQGCSVASIELPNQMDTLGDYAFYDCYALTNVKMPTSLSYMADECFSYSGIRSITIPNGLLVIPAFAFCGCFNLTEITWGDAVTTIGLNAFFGCPFTSLHFPATLRTIRMGAFGGGNTIGDLHNVTFSAPVDTIGPEAFMNQNLESLHLRNTTPPVTLDPLETDDPTFGCFYHGTVDSIFIPCGSLNDYLADEYWGRFENKYYEQCTGIDQLEADNVSVVAADNRITIKGAENQPVSIFDAGGRTIYLTPNAAGTIEVPVHMPGIYIVKVGNLPTKKVVNICR